MNDHTSPIAIRAYPVFETEKRERSATRPYWKSRRNREPTTALIFDCETRTDLTQRLTVGFAVEIKSHWKLKQHQVVRVICFADERALSTPEKLTVEEWVRALISSKLRDLEIDLHVLTVPADLPIEYQSLAFRETFYRVGHEQRGAIVGFNLPFDISRIADSSGVGRRDNQAHVFTLIPLRQHSFRSRAQTLRMLRVESRMRSSRLRTVAR